MRQYTSSIERKVVRTFVGFAVLLTVFHAGLALLITYVIEDEIIARILADELQYLQHSYAQTGEMPTPRVGYMTIYPGTELAPQAVREELAKHPDRQEIFTDDKRHFHIRLLHFSESNQALLVAEVSPLLVVTNISANLLTILMTVLVLVVGIAVGLAYRIAKQTTRPIIELSDEVKRGKQAHETLTLSASGRDDEVGYLADTIQASFNELRGALERESHFTRDVSHELRTPLTVMKNCLALLTQRSAKALDIVQLQQAVGHMQATVEVLLALAREESLQMQRLKLRPVLEESVLSMHKVLEQQGFQVTVALTDDYEVDGNPQLIALLMTNLIENAVQYAAEPQLSITLEDDGICFSNRIASPIIDDPTAPARKQANSQGLGQGLYLVRRIAEALNWELSTHAEQQLFSVHLQLPEQEINQDISP